MRSLCQRLQRQVIIRHGRFGDGRHPTRYYPSVPTQGYSTRCCAIRRVQVTEEATACGRTNHSPQSKEQSSERLGNTGTYKGGTTSPGGRSDWSCRFVQSDPTKGYTYHRYTSSASVVDKARRVTRCRDARSERPLYQKLQHRSFNDNGRTDRASLQRVTRLIVTRFALTQWTHDHEFIQILVLQRLMAELVVLM